MVHSDVTGEAKISEVTCEAKMAKFLHRWRDDLQVSLKTLSILYQQEDKTSQELPPELGSAATAGAALAVDRLYLNMLMLNSALLKALHVADSCQSYCQRECTALSEVQEQPGASGSSDEAEPRLPGRRYRHLQCRIEAERELVSAMLLDEEEKSAQRRKIEDDCREMELKAERSAGPEDRSLSTAPSAEAAEAAAPLSPGKAEFLRGRGLAPEQEQVESGGRLRVPVDALRQTMEQLLQGLEAETALRAQREAEAAALRRAELRERAERCAGACGGLAGEELRLGGRAAGEGGVGQLVAELVREVQRFPQQLLEEEAEAQRREQQLREQRPAAEDPDPARLHREPSTGSPSPSSPHGGLGVGMRRQLAGGDRPQRAAWERMLQEAVAEDHSAALLSGGLRQEAAQQPGRQQVQQPPPQQPPAQQHHLFTRVASASSFADQIRGRAGSFLLSGNVRAAAPGGGAPAAAEATAGDGAARSPERGTFARTGSAALPPRPKWLEHPTAASVSPREALPAAAAARPADAAESIRRIVSGPSFGSAVPVEVRAAHGSFAAAAPAAAAQPAAEEAEPLPAMGASPERSGPLFAEAEGRPSARSRPPGGLSTRGGSVHELPQRSKPFVVCSSVRSHHAAAQGQARTAQKQSHGGLMEDRQFTKAALRLSRNPSDTQALGKLASLLGGGRAQKASASHSPGPGEEPAVAPGQPRAASPEGVGTPMLGGGSARIDAAARSASPRPLAPACAGEAPAPAAHGLGAVPGKVPGSPAWPAWPSARATFPTAEQRAQQRAAASQQVVRCQRPQAAPQRAEDPGSAAALQQPQPQTPQPQPQQQQPQQQQQQLPQQPLSARACHEHADAQQQYAAWQVRDGRSQSPEAQLQRLDVVRSASPPLSLCSAAAAAVAAASGSPRASKGPALAPVVGPVWPPWPASSRATWPTPEQRAHMAAAAAAAGTAQAHYACTNLRPSPNPSPRSGG